MAYRSYSQTPLNITLVMFDEYGRKLAEFAGFTAGSALVFAVLSVVGCYALDAERNLANLLACGSRLLLDIFPEPSFRSSIAPNEVLWPFCAVGFVPF